MRFLHTMLRVGDLQRSVRFYTEVLGMKLLRTTDRPEQKYSLAFVGYDDEKRAAVLELTYNYGVERYELGTAFGHVAIGVTDVKQACDKVRANGGRVTREPGPVTKLKTPGGRSASTTHSASAMPAIAVVDAGVQTTVFPQASAGAISSAGIVYGQFHGVITPITPRGRRKSSTFLPRDIEFGRRPSRRFPSSAAFRQ